MNQNRKCFIMGEPNAGKTTFLAALWHSLDQVQTETKLKLERYKGNSNYLFGLSSKWLAIEDMDRTLIGYEKEDLQIELSDGKSKFELCFPDLSGETFLDIYEKRKIDNNIVKMIKEADAILYFVNIRDIKDPIFITELLPELRMQSEEIEMRDAVNDDPTQVKIIELLQIVLKVCTNRNVKVGIIFSAWDLVDEEICPDDYLEKHMNMLWQYIQSNKSALTPYIWGLSALGADIQKADNIEKLADIPNPIERIKVVDKSGVSNDITTIIYEMVGVESDRKS